jgi:hypothetical protein
MFTKQVVAVTSTPSGSSIALDSLGHPHIVYEQYDGNIKHAWKQGATWHTEQVAYLGAVTSGYDRKGFALGGDVMHVVWATGGFIGNYSPTWTYPNLPTDQALLQVHHAFSTVGSGIWTEEIIWTESGQQEGNWVWHPITSTWGWTWTKTWYTLSWGVSVAVDSSGNAHVLFAHEYEPEVGTSSSHGPRAILYLNGASGWAVTQLQTFSTAGNLGISVAYERGIWCDSVDDLHALWWSNRDVTVGGVYQQTMRYAKSTAWGTVIDLVQISNSYHLTPISIGADGSGVGVAFYVNSMSNDDAAFLLPIGGSPESIGAAWYGNPAFSAGVPALAYSDGDVLTYQQNISGTWTPDAFAPTGTSYASLAQPADAVMPHICWCDSGHVMYATLLASGRWTMG